MKISFVADDCPRSNSLRESISKTLRAAIIGRSGTVAEVDSQTQHDVQFVLDGCPTYTASGCIDLTQTLDAGCDHNFFGQPCLRDLATIGKQIPVNIKDKVDRLDDKDFGWTVILQDDTQPPSHDNWMYEGHILSDPSRLSKFSHVLLHSSSGDPLICDRLVGQQGCLLFASGLKDRNAVDGSMIVICSSPEEFLIKAESVANSVGGSPSLFKKIVAPKVYSPQCVSARDARAVIGSMLKMKSGRDFGLLDLHVADKRLVDLAKRGTMK